MRIVIDSNRVLAAMVKDSTTREILFDEFFEFLAPEHIIAETTKHKERIINASGLAEEEFEILASLIFERITIIPEAEYREIFSELKNEIRDQNDLPYFASAIMVNADGIWTHDEDFLEQKRVKIFTNIDMLRISGKDKGSL